MPNDKAGTGKKLAHGLGQNQSRAGVESVPGNARDREMGRTLEPLGDLGHKKTWQPPSGEQGISNRPADEPSDDKPRRQEAFASGATSRTEFYDEETAGRQENRQPKDQDAKAQNGPRNRNARLDDPGSHADVAPDDDRERPGGDQNRHGDRGGTS